MHCPKAFFQKCYSRIRASKYPLTNYDTAQICHGTVNKMAGIFTKGMVATLWWRVGKFALKNVSTASGVKRNFLN